MAESVKWGSTEQLLPSFYLEVFTVVSRAPKRGVGGSNLLGDGLQSVRKC